MSGLYNKYKIIDRETGEEKEGSYFVLKPEEDSAALAALASYAHHTNNKKLSADLWGWIWRILKV